MNILIAYASVEGQTRKIAEHMAATVEAAGHRVELADLGQPGFAIPVHFDGTILAAPIHIGRYPSSMVDFVQNWKSVLIERPSALVTVSLLITSTEPNETATAEAYPKMLEHAAGWAPELRHNAAGALKYVEYDFFKRWVLRSIAAKFGGPVDTSKDYEFTDWAALDAFVGDFLAAAARKQGSMA